MLLCSAFSAENKNLLSRTSLIVVSAGEEIFYVEYCLLLKGINHSQVLTQRIHWLDDLIGHAGINELC